MNTGAQLRADRFIVDLSHEERIELVADGASESFQPEAIDDSWRRCLRDFHVDPQSSSVPHLLTERELRISREPLDSFLLQAQEEIDRLYAIVRTQSYVVLLCNSDGVAIYHRGDDSKDQEFNRFDQDAMLAAVEKLIQSGPAAGHVRADDEPERYK
jgi:transcriptional regulator of acetoin/glycerol metabolism